MGCFSSKEADNPNTHSKSPGTAASEAKKSATQTQAPAPPVAQPKAAETQQAAIAQPVPGRIPAEAPPAVVQSDPVQQVAQRQQEALANSQGHGTPPNMVSPASTGSDTNPLPVNGVMDDPIAGHSRYRTLEKLGMGAFGSVWLCENGQTGDKVAVKILERGLNVKYVRREVINHSKIHCHQVIEFKEVFLTQDHLGLVLELATGGDLLSYINDHPAGLPETEARWIFQQLVIGVHHCHECGVVNRDLKPENCLIIPQPGRAHKPLVKICDFGYSKQMDASSLMASKVGTPGYIAPEVMQNEGDSTYGPAADIWSLGVLLYVLLFRMYPFLDASEAANANTQGQFMVILKRIINASYEFPAHVEVSHEAKSLIQRMLVVSPQQRITIPQIIDDPWFRADLPQRAFAVPYKSGQRRKGLQSEEEINEILGQAQRRSAPAK